MLDFQHQGLRQTGQEGGIGGACSGQLKVGAEAVVQDELFVAMLGTCGREGMGMDRMVAGSNVSA